jgi:hypothetical protein
MMVGQRRFAEAVSTISMMSLFAASGNVCHESTIRAKSGFDSAKRAQTAAHLAASDSGIVVFPGEFACCSILAGQVLDRGDFDRFLAFFSPFSRPKRTCLWG